VQVGSAQWKLIVRGLVAVLCGDMDFFLYICRRNRYTLYSVVASGIRRAESTFSARAPRLPPRHETVVLRMYI